VVFGQSVRATELSSTVGALPNNAQGRRIALVLGVQLVLAALLASHYERCCVWGGGAGLGL